MAARRTIDGSGANEVKIERALCEAGSLNLKRGRKGAKSEARSDNFMENLFSTGTHHDCSSSSGEFRTVPFDQTIERDNRASGSMRSTEHDRLVMYLC